MIEKKVFDHLGNNRVSFKQDGSSAKLLSQHHYYPFGERGCSSHTDGSWPKRDGTIAPQRSKARVVKSVISASRDESYCGLEMNGSWTPVIKNDYNYLYNGKEQHRDFGLEWYNYGARYMDPSIGRFISVDPMADAAPGWTPYRYAFNNPLKFIDPDGKYEWRINSQTGEYERFGDKGGDSEQFVYWDDAKESAFSLSGETIYVGEASFDRYSEGQFGYGVSTTDLWSNVPDEYIGDYTIFDLKEREEARQAGGAKFENIQQQEQAGLARRDQIWNTWDKIYSIEQRGGQANGLTLAFDERLIDKMLPGGLIATGAAAQNAAARHGARVRGGTSFTPSAAPAAKPLSWNQFQKFTRGKFKGPDSRRQTASAYKKYKADFNSN